MPSASLVSSWMLPNPVVPVTAVPDDAAMDLCRKSDGQRLSQRIGELGGRAEFERLGRAEARPYNIDTLLANRGRRTTRLASGRIGIGARRRPRRVDPRSRWNPQWGRRA